jgi:uncharacterized protein with ParB-like and HNH nuclease domain
MSETASVYDSDDSETATVYDSEESELDSDYQISEYDLTAVPNDFNVMTINTLVESDALKIPGFQRNYVWDQKRASKLIESLIIGLPVPQIFLFEEAKNEYLVVDGHQRLMTLYYFIHQRFPRFDKRREIRDIFDREGKISPDTFKKDDLFQNFNLQLSTPGNPKSRFQGMSYDSLSEYKVAFEMRTIRVVIVKANNTPPGKDGTAIFELFNRLNTGGVNLKPQEIRMSLYHSDFLTKLAQINLDENWRRLISKQADIRLRDLEILLRSLAFSNGLDNLASTSILGFINKFALEMKLADKDKVAKEISQLTSFLTKTKTLKESVFKTSKNKFLTLLFEAVFVVCKDFPSLDGEKIEELKNDKEFLKLTSGRTTNKDTVEKRYEKALEILSKV